MGKWGKLPKPHALHGKAGPLGQCCNSALEGGKGCKPGKELGMGMGFYGTIWSENVKEWECERKCKYTSEDIVACMFYWNKCLLYTREQFGNQVTGGNNHEDYTCWLRKGI